MSSSSYYLSKEGCYKVVSKWIRDACSLISIDTSSAQTSTYKKAIAVSAAADRRTGRPADRQGSVQSDFSGLFQLIVQLGNYTEMSSSAYYLSKEG